MMLKENIKLSILYLKACMNCVNCLKIMKSGSKPTLKIFSTYKKYFLNQ